MRTPTPARPSRSPIARRRARHPLPTGTLLLCLTAAVQASDSAVGQLPAVNVTDAAPAPDASLNLHTPNSTGSRLELSPRDTPASVSVVDRAQIASRGITRAQDAVTGQPGLAESPSPGNGFSALSARGFVGHNSVAQLVDGTRMSIAAGSTTYPFSTWPLESVQVLRGPASVLYGDGAIGAVVNYVTMKPLFERSERQAMLSVGQHGTLQGGVGFRGPISDTLAYSAYLDAARSSGERRDSAYARQNASLALTARPTSRLATTLMFDGGRSNDATYFGTPLADGAVPPAWRRASFNVGDARARYRDQAWRLRVAYDVADGVQLRNEAYHLRSDRRWRNAESYRLNPATGWVDRSDFIDVGHDLALSGNRLEVQADGRVGGLAHKLLLGLQAQRTSFDMLSNSPYGGSDSVNPAQVVPGVFDSPDAYGLSRRTRLDSSAVFAESHWKLSPRWTVLGGLRAERLNLRTQNLRSDAAPERVRHSPVTGRLGSVFKASDTLSLYGQFATATDPLSGALSLPGGTTTNDLTRGRQWEIGAKGDVPALRGEWSAALYQITKRNLLSRDVDNPTVTQQIGRQSSTGIELAFAAEPLRGWTLDANMALLRARYDQFVAVSGGRSIDHSGQVPTGAPQRLFNLWSSWRLAPQWRLGAGLRHVGRRPLNPANSAWLPSVTLVNAALTYLPTPGSSLSLTVNNLTDRVYPVSGGSGQWLLGAGRSVALTARLTF